jgi:hypothetical protein
MLLGVIIEYDPVLFQPNGETEGYAAKAVCPFDVVWSVGVLKLSVSICNISR